MDSLVLKNINQIFIVTQIVLRWRINYWLKYDVLDKANGLFDAATMLQNLLAAYLLRCRRQLGAGGGPGSWREDGGRGGGVRWLQPANPTSPVRSAQLMQGPACAV